MRRSLPIVLLFLVTVSPVLASKRACIAPNDTVRHVNKDVCVAVHVYRVVDAANGIHFLDVCSPETTDVACHFFILSLGRDEKAVGDLESLVGQNIQIRGTVHTIQGRAEIVLSSQHQLHGGKEPFHPNPQLVRSFSAENGGQGFSPKNGIMGQHGVHFSHMKK